MPPNPPQLFVRDFPTPEVKDGILVELIDNNKGAYTPIPIGSRCPEQSDSKYAGYELVDVRTSQDYQWTYRYWANAATNQDIYNRQTSYEGESLSFPVFKRSYVERRPYTPRARGLPLTAVVGAVVTNGGSGYTTAPTVSLTGGSGTGATAEALLYRGAVIYVRILTEGTGYTTVPSIGFSGGGGAGAAATALIQPQGALLVQEEQALLPEGDPRSGLYDLVVRIWMTLPGPIFSKRYYDPSIRGVLVLETTQKGLVGTLDPETGDGVITSETDELTTVVEERTTKVIDDPSHLPPDESWAYWDYVGLPLLLFDIVNTFFCNNSQFFSLVTNPLTAAGSSVLRKHRVTVSYSLTPPDLVPDYSASAFETADIRYQGKVIQFSYGNVLNDAISYDNDFYTISGMGACFWTEAYDFPATTPSATDFLAGAWFTKEAPVVTFGEGMYKLTHVEYYSASGNPAI